MSREKPIEECDAWEDLQGALEPGETVESIVFGDYGWGSDPDDPRILIPKVCRGVPMTPAEARPLMKGWTFSGGFGGPDVWATYVWTNQRVLFVHEYDGSTGLRSVPRQPIKCDPELSGGTS